jgi:anti-anti-sigma factor
VDDAGPNSYFQVTVDTSVDPVVVRAAGELDASSSGDLLRAIEEASAAGGDVRLELADVTFIDSSGLRVVTIAHRQARDGDHTLTVASASDAVRRVFEMTGVSMLLAP